MTVVLDASALLALHIEGAQRDVVRDMLENDTTWVACAIALSESIVAASRLTDEVVLSRHLEDMIRHTWDFLHVIPIDQSLLKQNNCSTKQPRSASHNHWESRPHCTLLLPLAFPPPFASSPLMPHRSPWPCL